MIEYTLGFLFAEDYNTCLLVQKTKPDFMAGFWNGIGGKIEEQDETTWHAMYREFVEETKLMVNWEPFATIHRPEAVIHCFKSAWRDIAPVSDVNDAGEKLQWLTWRDASPLFESVPMLIHLAILDPMMTVDIHLEEPKCATS